MSLRAATLYLLRYSNGEIRLFSAGVGDQTTENMTNVGFPHVCDSRFAYDLSDEAPINALSPIDGIFPLVLSISLISLNGMPASKAQSSIEYTISNLGVDYMTKSARDWTLRVLHELRTMGFFAYSGNSLENELSNANNEYIQNGGLVRKDINFPCFH